MVQTVTFEKLANTFDTQVKPESSEVLHPLFGVGFACVVVKTKAPAFDNYFNVLIRACLDGDT